VTGEQALRELVDVSEDIVGALILDSDGEPLAATVADDEARRAAGTARAMLAHAEALRTDGVLRRLEAATPEGSLFVVREADRVVIAATGPDPVAGLVYHDLGACLRKLRGRAREKAHAAS
jgi:predicted regulator of Ras-like GTPase activity (Roadblock/LC7/MglB family)